ncbi:hypothetical protein BH09BAC2_BH09BAC2_12610 [soil metagenome]
MEILNKYVYDPKTDIIGKGGFATVYKAYDKVLDMQVALKFFHASEADNKYNVINEIKKAIKFAHPNIVRYYGVESLVGRNVHGQEEDIQIGIMEYIQEGQMKTFLNKNPVDKTELKKLLIDILEGLKYLHSQDIIHRDIKPQNILLGRDKQNKLIAKIADFGISKAVDSQNTSSSVLLGTVEYMAPEQFNPERYGINKKISKNIDIWAFGITAYYLIIGEHFFGARSGETSPGELINKIVNVENLDEKISKLDEPFRTLVSCCVVPDAKNRTSNIDDLISILNGDLKKVHSVGPIDEISDTNAQPFVRKTFSAETQIIEQAPPPVMERKVSEQKQAQTPSAKKEKHVVAESDGIDKPKSNKNLFIIGGVFLLLLLAGGGYWFFMKKDDVGVSAATTSATNPGNDKPAFADKLFLMLDQWMMPVAGGSFTMGDDKSDYEKPSHKVTVADFKLMSIEVPQELWRTVMNDSKFSDSSKGNIPVNNVSFTDVNTFINKLNEFNKKYGNAKLTYRLPTEEEWEYAALKGGQSGDINSYSWNKNNSGGTIHPGAAKKANSLGLYDMFGNVYEWCNTDFRHYNKPDEAVQGKVVRGGDYKNDVYFVSSKVRNAEVPDKSETNIGFRLAATVTNQ